MQFGQSPVRQYSPRRRWNLNERENVRTPARNSAEAIVSPGSSATRRPSKSSDVTDLVRARVPLDRQVPPAAGVVEPSLGLHPGHVRAHPDPLEVMLERVARLGRRPSLPIEPELRILAAAAAWAYESQRHEQGSTI